MSLLSPLFPIRRTVLASVILDTFGIPDNDEGILLLGIRNNLSAILVEMLSEWRTAVSPPYRGTRSLRSLRCSLRTGT